MQLYLKTSRYCWTCRHNSLLMLHQTSRQTYLKGMQCAVIRGQNITSDSSEQLAQVRITQFFLHRLRVENVVMYRDLMITCIASSNFKSHSSLSLLFEVWSSWAVQDPFLLVNGMCTCSSVSHEGEKWLELHHGKHPCLKEQRRLLFACNPLWFLMLMMTSVVVYLLLR